MAVNLIVGDDALHLEITGWFDKLMCLSPGQHIPLSEVTGARLASWDDVRPTLGWRVGGAYWPKRIATGWYTDKGRSGHRQFLAVFRHRDQLLVIDTTVKTPSHIVLESADRERLAWWINERVPVSR